MEKHFPIFVVILPLLAAIIGSFLRGKFICWLWACVTTTLVFSMAVVLLQVVMINGSEPLIYAVGNWPAPFGIELRFDVVNSWVLVVVTAIGAVVTFASKASIESEIPEDRLSFFYSLWLLALVGLCGMIITGDAFNLYVLLEISSLAIYGLVAMGKNRDRRALTASFNYIILGSIGASFILLGIGYLYMVTGTLNMADMHNILMSNPTVGGVPLQESRTVLVAFCFLMVGLGLKMALFPFHMWLPNSYAYAPSAVSAFLAATATKVGIYMAIRFIYTIFGVEYCFNRVPNNLIFMICTSMAIILGSLAAFRQNNVKKILAYSSVAQIGYIVLGMCLANQQGLSGSLIHILNHALIQGGLFLAVAAVVLQVGSADLKDFAGLGRRMPFSMAAILVGGLALVGVPLTGGFVSKWYLVSGALTAGLWPLALVILIGSFLAMGYVWRMIEIIYFKPPDETIEVSEAPLGLVMGTWILIGASVYFGVFAQGPSIVVESAARQLLGGNL